jgi:TonB family protein
MELSPPPRNADQAAPATVPAALPQEDHSRDYGSAAGTGSGGMSTGSGGTGTGSGGTGTGAAGSGGGTSRILDLDFSLVRPKYRPPAPAYPPLARNAGVQGEVAVQITIGPDGVPVSAHAAAGPQQLRAAAETNSLAWRFYPYLQDGTPQFCRFLVTFTFRIK